jgi:hypothetical protein
MFQIINILSNENNQKLLELLPDPNLKNKLTQLLPIIKSLSEKEKKVIVKVVRLCLNDPRLLQNISLLPSRLGLSEKLIVGAFFLKNGSKIQSIFNGGKIGGGRRRTKKFRNARARRKRITRKK